SQFNIDESGEVLIRYPYIETEEHVDEVVDLAKSKNAIVVFTIITPVLRRYIQQELKSEEIPSVDIMGPLMRVMEGKTREQPYYGSRRVQKLGVSFCTKMVGVECAVKCDGGIDAGGLDKADIVLFGVSRPSTSPLSKFLASRK